MDYFNQNERKTQQKFSKWRDRTLSPLIDGLIKIKVNQNHISFLGVVFLIFACLFIQNNFFYTAIFLALYLFCDGIDGGIARKKGEQSEAGSIIDITCDQLGVVFVSAALAYHADASAVLCVLFSNFYIAFIVLVLFFNEKEITLFNFLRVKYVLYVIYVFHDLLNPKAINAFLLVFSVYYFSIFTIGLNLLLKNKKNIEKQ